MSLVQQVVDNRVVNGGFQQPDAGGKFAVFRGNGGGGFDRVGVQHQFDDGPVGQRQLLRNVLIHVVVVVIQSKVDQGGQRTFGRRRQGRRQVIDLRGAPEPLQIVPL